MKFKTNQVENWSSLERAHAPCSANLIGLFPVKFKLLEIIEMNQLRRAHARNPNYTNLQSSS